MSLFLSNNLYVGSSNFLATFHVPGRAKMLIWRPMEVWLGQLELAIAAPKIVAPGAHLTRYKAGEPLKAHLSPVLRAL